MRGPEQEREYISGTAKLDTAFELRYTPNGKGVASAKVEFNDIAGLRYGDLAIWEPEEWFGDADWLERMDRGATVGFRGTIRERTYKGQDGTQKTRREVTVYAIAPLWERPRRAS